MCGNHPKSTVTIKTFERSLGNCTTNHRLGSGTEFINQQKRFGIAVTNKKFHIQQMRTIGRKIIFNRLLITNIDKQTLKNTHPATVVQRDK